MKKCETAQTAHNRTVYAAGAVAPLASIRLGRYAPTAHSGTLGRAVFATQSPFMPAPTS
jgi:hypothetical protein